MTPGALKQVQAARYCGMSVNTFKLRVRPYVRYIKESPTLLLFPTAELDRWLDSRATGR